MHPHSGDSSRWAGGGASGELSRGFCADLLAEYHFNEIAVSRERWERLLSLSTNKSLPAGPAWQAGEHPTQAAFQAGKLFPGRCMAPATGSTQGCWKHGTERVGSRPVQLPRTGWGIWGLSSLLRCIRRCAARFPRRVGCWGGWDAKAHVARVEQKLLLQNHLPEQTRRPRTVPFARSW